MNYNFLIIYLSIFILLLRVVNILVDYNFDPKPRNFKDSPWKQFSLFLAGVLLFLVLKQAFQFHLIQFMYNILK